VSNSNYSGKERMLAKILTKLPTLKRWAKYFYVELNALLHKKKYRILTLSSKVNIIAPVIDTGEMHSSFFGYYDRNPSNSTGWVICHKTELDTQSGTRPDAPVQVNLSNLKTGEIVPVGLSSAYTWQQGTRAQWISDDVIIYNDYDTQEKSWISRTYSISERAFCGIYGIPVQDCFKDKFFLSLNYKRLYAFTEDYGYKNEGKVDKNSMISLEDDGIFYTDLQTKQTKLLFSLLDIISIDAKDDFKIADHTVNHIMISPSGDKFIFIHRYYVKGVRYDRLLLSDFKSISVLSDDRMVSHCCWFDDCTIYGYLRHQDHDGYYFIDIYSKVFSLNKVVDDLGLGDGHPNVYKNLIVFDTYPDKSRMQGLFIYDHSTGKVEKLLEVLQPTSYRESSRCDLHPRFSNDGKIIFFDSVYEKGRKQYYVKLN